MRRACPPCQASGHPCSPWHAKCLVRDQPHQTSVGERCGFSRMTCPLPKRRDVEVPFRGSCFATFTFLAGASVIATNITFRSSNQLRQHHAQLHATPRSSTKRTRRIGAPVANACPPQRSHGEVTEFGNAPMGFRGEGAISCRHFEYRIWVKNPCSRLACLLYPCLYLALLGSPRSSRRLCIVLIPD
jgi:hypothetical protein